MEGQETISCLQVKLLKHKLGQFFSKGIEQDFCIKTSKDVSYNWPEGKYCILKHEACPYGLSGG